MSQFLDTLGNEPHHTLLKEVFNALVQRLGVRSCWTWAQTPRETPRL